MLKFFGKYYAMYICGAAALLIAMAAASSKVTDSLAASFLLIGFVLVLVWCFFCNKRANTSYIRMVDILSEQCDPEGFLKAQRKVYRRACKVKSIRSAVSMNGVTVRMNQAVALSFAGKNEEAMEEIHAILALPAAKNRDFYHGMCHINLAVFRTIDGGDIAAAREHIRKACEHNKAMGHTNSMLSGEIIRAEYIVDTAEGKNLEAALDFFKKKTDSAINTRDEAGNRWARARIYRQLGDTENERAQLEFVAQKAPKAYIGKQAAARLEELSA